MEMALPEHFGNAVQPGVKDLLNCSKLKRLVIPRQEPTIVLRQVHSTAHSLPVYACTITLKLRWDQRFVGWNL